MASSAHPLEAAAVPTAPPRVTAGSPAAVEIRNRLATAAALGLLAEACVSASTTWRAHSSIGATIFSGVEAAAFLALPFALLAAPLAWLLARPELRLLGRHLRDGLSGGHPERAPVAVVVCTGLLAAAARVTAYFGLVFVSRQSAQIAIMMTIIVMMLTILASLSLTVILARYVSAALARVSKRAPKFVQSVAPHAAIAAIAVGTVFSLIPSTHAVTPAASVLGFAMAPALGVSLVRRSGARPILYLLIPALVASIAAALTLTRVPDTVQLAVLYRAPYASLLIAGARGAVDRDGDGYSPILMGGDCNDSNAKVHPGAMDIPNNGVDENCSGADAHRFVPPLQEPSPVRAAPVTPGAGKPNIVFIQLDALRPDHLSFTGYPRHTTPRIDEFRKTATWFKNSYTPAPTTRLAMASFFTGLEVERVPQNRGPGNKFTLLPDAVTTAERLEPLGYDRVGYTISFVAQHVKEIGQGFRIWDTPWPTGEWSQTYAKAAALTTDASLEYLKTVPQDGTKPYFLFMHYQCTHDPYVKHQSWDYGDADIDLYDSALSYCDDQIGKFFDALDARADHEQTAIILMSDHGELFHEHGLTNHGNSLYEPDVRTVLLARLPNGKVTTVNDPVTLTDLGPTILDLVGAPRVSTMQGWSLVPYTLTTPATPRLQRAIFLYADLWRGTVHYQARGIVDARHKFTRDIGTGMTQLFDLDRDPEELSNLVDTTPVMRGRLSELLDSWEAFEGTH